MKIVILAKEVPDTWGDRKLDSQSGRLDRSVSELVPDEINERALEQALEYRDSGNTVEVVTLTLAPESADKSVRKLLAMGADSGIIISDASLTGADATRTARVLASAIHKLDADLVIAGNESTDGRGGVVPAMIAEHLGWPVLPSLNTLEITETTVRGETVIDGEQLSIRGDFPVVVAVTELVGEARFPNFKGIMKAKKKPLEVWSLDRIGETVPSDASSVMVSANQRPERVAGPKVVDDGEAAAQLIAFLASRKLI